MAAPPWENRAMVSVMRPRPFLCSVLVASALTAVIHRPEGAQAQVKQARTAAPATSNADSVSDEARRARVVASGTGFSITLGMLEDQINKQPRALRERYRNRTEQQKLLDEMVRLELLAQEAKRRDFDDASSVKSTVKDSSVQALLRSEIDDKISPESISAEAVKNFYEQNAADFHRAEQRRASQIVLATLDEAQTLLEEAKGADLRQFNELARKHSLDGETKLRGGDLGFFPLSPPAHPERANIPEEVRKAAFQLKKAGDTTKAPVVVGEQFIIVRLTGIHPERHVELSQAESSIRTRLWRQERQNALTALLDSLRKNAHPEVFTARVDLVKFDDMDGRPAGFAPDRPSDAPAKTVAPKPVAQ